MIKTVPLSLEEQSFLVKTVANGVSNGGFFMGNDAIGIIGFVAAFIFTLSIITKKGKNKWLSIIFKSFLGLSILAMFLALLSFDPMNKIRGSIDFFTNMSQLFYMIAMIINEPDKWWRTLLIGIPGLFLPKAIQNVFRGRPWHFNSIGKFVGNLYAGLALTVISTIILVTTGKSQRQLEQEQLKINSQ